MTADEQISRLDTRIDRLENQWLEEIRRVHEKLNTLTESDANAKGPLALVTERLENQIVAHNSTMLRVERLEIRMLDKDKREAWLTGAWAVIAFVASIIGAGATLLLSHFLP